LKAVDREDTRADDETRFRGCETDGTIYIGGFGAIMMGEALVGPRLGATIVKGVMMSIAEVVN